MKSAFTPFCLLSLAIMLLLSNCHSKPITEQPSVEVQSSESQTPDESKGDDSKIEHFSKANPLFEIHSIDNIKIKVKIFNEPVSLLTLYPDCVRSDFRIKDPFKNNDYFLAPGTISEEEFNEILSLIDELFISKTSPIETCRTEGAHISDCIEVFIEITIYYNSCAKFKAPSVSQTEQILVNLTEDQDHCVISFSPQIIKLGTLLLTHADTSGFALS